jgi:multiple sugar transport system ATP-binding protein
MALVPIRSVEKYYGTAQIVRGVSIDISDGEFCVLVGPSGWRITWDGIPASSRVASASASPWGRAIVRNPQVFLFDEPLSNLDAKLRVSMRTELKAIHTSRWGRRSGSIRS